MQHNNNKITTKMSNNNNLNDLMDKSSTRLKLEASHRELTRTLNNHTNNVQLINRNTGVLGVTPTVRLEILVRRWNLVIFEVFEMNYWPTNRFFNIAPLSQPVGPAGRTLLKNRFSGRKLHFKNPNFGSRAKNFERAVWTEIWIWVQT